MQRHYRGYMQAKTQTNERHWIPDRLYVGQSLNAHCDAQFQN